MCLFCWTQRKIFWRMWETEQFCGTIDFHSIFFSYYWSQWCPKTAWLQTFFRISSFVFSITNTFIHVWTYLRVSKWWTIALKWSTLKEQHIMLRSKEMQEQMIYKIVGSISLENVIQLFLRLWDSSEPQSEPLSTNGENLQHWWTFPGLAGLPKLLQERNDDSSRRS